MLTNANKNELILRQARAVDLTVYYDGGCPVCSREITLYKQLTNPEDVLFVDASSNSFDEKVTGISRSKALQLLHASTSDGEILRGVDAFIAIWSQTPELRVLSIIAKNRFVKTSLEVGYRIFLSIRNRISMRSQVDTVPQQSKMPSTTETHH